MKTDARWQAIEVILSDVDGVLTDGGIVFDNGGIETKKFHVRDGLGIRLWQRAGFRFGIITARSSQIVKNRCAELGVNIVRQGFEDKLSVFGELIEQLKVRPEQVAYIGDDLSDLPVIRNAGMGIAVSDAADEVCEAADHVTQRAGGCGAVRETIEAALKAKNRWDDLIRKYTA